MQSFLLGALALCAGLAALAVALLGGVLASVLRGGYAPSDKRAGLVVGLLSLLWLALPGAGLWFLYGLGRARTGALLLGAALLLSLGLARVAMSAIEAGSRP